MRPTVSNNDTFAIAYKYHVLGRCVIPSGGGPDGKSAQLQAYAYRHKLVDSDRFFPITRSQAFRIVATAFDQAGVTRPRRDVDRVGAVHILRHSGAIERLRQTGNPKAVQDRLRHKSALMTMRYLKTLSHEESLRIQQGVEFQW